MAQQQLEMNFFADVQEQVRLKEITVYNWGSFNGIHTMHIDVNGTLITGENGSGKSTIIDGLMTLLRPASKVDYNLAAAQDQKRDRTLVSYIRGSYGSYIDNGSQISRNARQASVLSMVSAVYEFTASHTQVALLGIFYIIGDSNAYADVHKIYAIASQPFVFRDVIRSFADYDPRRLKTYLRTLAHCHVCDDNFTEYETHFKHQLRMDNKNAPALLSRALGLKKIDDLTTLIRTLVLEQGTVKQEAQNTIKQFEDLKAVHEKLEDAKEQEATLNELPAAVSRMEKAQANVELHTRAETEAQTYINKFAINYYNKRKTELELKIKNLTAQLNDEQNKLNYAKSYREECHTALIKGGGSEPERIKKEIERCKRELITVEQNYNDLAKLLNNLQQPMVNSAEDFAQMQIRLQSLKEDLNSKLEANDEAQVNIGMEHKSARQTLQTLEAEMQVLQERRDSNLPTECQELRRNIALDLGIEPKKLVYIAELIEVKEQEKSWQGAIERALGGLRKTLLVSKEECPLITKWVNNHFTGLHVRVQAVELDNIHKVEFGNKGFLTKLNFKDHLYSNWLKQHLNKFDLFCASSIEELNSTDFSMTKEGLIHKNKGFYEKKDSYRVDDKMQWYTGFSNTDKLTLLAQNIAQEKTKLKDLENRISQIKIEKNELRTKDNACVSLSRFTSYSALDTKSLNETLKQLTNQYEEAISSPTLAQLQSTYDKSIKEVERIEKLVFNIAKQQSSVEKEEENVTQKIAQINAQPTIELHEESINILNKICKDLKIATNEVFLNDNPTQIHQRLNLKVKNLIDEKGTAANAVTKIINRFFNKWESICIDWGSDLESYPNYLNHLTQIRADGLPKLVEEFKAKLNRDVTQSIVTIDSSIQQELNSISDRITKINNVLQKAEFSENTYLEIEAKKILNPVLSTFSRNIKNVMNSINDPDPEHRYKYIARVIDNLNEALNSNAQDYKPLLDPRLRMQFLAKVIDINTKQIKDTLNSSSGKSGGEKESFAGCVLAASLAYVLTPENAEYPIYSTVFLDEAFSNTSDKVSKRVLKIFKELKLHVNLITPFKNIELARDYASSLVIMEKDPNVHSSSMCELTWKEYDEQLDNIQHEELAAEGISIIES